jgi:pyruvate dehydrogenase E1 component
VHSDVWSVTSWTELRRQALAVDDWNRAHPEQPPRSPYVTRRLSDAPGPVVAVSDWMRAVPDQITPFVPGGWSSLGTDGFGRSDTRRALRGHFRVDAPSIVLRTLEQLIARHELDSSVRDKAMEAYRLDVADGPTAAIATARFGDRVALRGRTTAVHGGTR